MKRLLLLSLCLVLAGAVTASAQPLIGGHDETSENMQLSWFVGPANPAPSGFFAPGPIEPHILLSEICVTPTAGEFIEICNATGQPVDLTNTYLSDDWYASGGALPPTSCYCFLPVAGYAGTVGFYDFIVQFPAGAVIQPWQTLVVAFDGAGFITTYGFPADFELFGTDPGTPDMIDWGGAAASAGLTNSAEPVVMFHWDGIADNVCDVDYVMWDDSSPDPTRYIDKTGTAVDGPDADAIATMFLPDTPAAAQVVGTSPGTYGQTLQRYECTEMLGNEMPGPGNGCVPGATPTTKTTWGQIKTLYR
jgi:hypothetical protein